jgi:hypothetical protein
MKSTLGVAFLLGTLGTAAAFFPLRPAAAQELPVDDSVSADADAGDVHPCAGPGPGFRLAAAAPGWTNVVPASGSGQTFVATRPHITGIEVDLVTANPKAGARDTLTLTLSTFAGDILTQVHRTLDSGREGWVCFPMPEGGIDVTPGDTLTLRLADTGAVLFGWRYGNDTYPKGHAVMLNRADRRFDFAFRAHDAISAASDPR